MNPKEKSAAVGAKNLATWKAENGDQRASLRHGIGAVMTTGDIPEAVPGAAEVAEQVDALIGEMVSDLGGEGEVTAQRKVIVESQRMCLSVLLLAGSYLRREGLMNKRRRPHPLLGYVVSYVNAARLNALALGLDRRAKSVETLETVLAEYANKS